MTNCKRCDSEATHKNGILRDKQRYKCELGGYNFVLGDDRTKPKTAIK